MSDEEYQYHQSDLDLAGDPDAGEWSIRCKDVYKRLGGVPVLNGLNVAFPEDTITVVLGPSGTGVRSRANASIAAAVGDTARSEMPSRYSRASRAARSSGSDMRA